MNNQFIGLFLVLLASFLFSTVPAQDVLPIFFKQDPGIVIDGKLSLDDWSDIKSAIVLDTSHGNRGAKPGQEWKSEANLSGTVKLAYRKDGFCLGAKVSDDLHVP